MKFLKKRHNRLRLRSEMSVDVPNDPCEWADSIGEHWWSRQKEVATAVHTNVLTSIKSGHGVGKTRLCAALAAHWILSHPPKDVLVVFLAPTWKQIHEGLMRELEKIHHKYAFPGSITQGKWRIGHHQVLACRSPQKTLEGLTHMQGLHARFLLLIIDEACGIPFDLWLAAMSLVSGPDTKAMAIGNPTEPDTPFHGTFIPPGDDNWHNETISILDSPNFTDEPCPVNVKNALSGKRYEKQMREEGTPNTYCSRVLGEFPEESMSCYYMPTLVRQSVEKSQTSMDVQERESYVWGNKDHPLVLGVDPGRGGDPTVMYARRGDIVLNCTPIVLRKSGDSDRNGKIVADFAKDKKANFVFYDTFGVGQNHMLYVEVN